MSLIDGGIGREAIEIAVPVDVPDPNALASREHDFKRLAMKSEARDMRFPGLWRDSTLPMRSRPSPDLSLQSI